MYGHTRSVRQVTFYQVTDILSLRENTLVFRQGLNRKDLQSTLILPARTKTFEQLVELVGSFIVSTASMESTSATSQRVLFTEAEPDAEYCWYKTGRRFHHHVDNCYRRHSPHSLHPIDSANALVIILHHHEQYLVVTNGVGSVFCTCIV